MRESRQYKAAYLLPRGPKGAELNKLRVDAFGRVKRQFAFRDYDLHKWSPKHVSHTWVGEHLDSQAVQALCTRAFRAAEQYSFGKSGRPRFKGPHQLDSIEGTTNEMGIRWRDNHIEWFGLRMAALVHPKDEVVAHALSRRVKYVRLIRRKLNGKSRYYAHLVCEGVPYQKAKNRVGEGAVGLDIGPSSIAAVAPQSRVAFLELICHDLRPCEKTIRRMQRKLDRQRRANNPDQFGSDGMYIKTAKPWRRSGRQRRTQAKLADLHRRQPIARAYTDEWSTVSCRWEVSFGSKSFPIARSNASSPSPRGPTLREHSLAS